MPIRGVADAMREMRAGSKHIRTRKQAIAVGLKMSRKGGMEKALTDMARKGKFKRKKKKSRPAPRRSSSGY